MNPFRMGKLLETFRFNSHLRRLTERANYVCYTHSVFVVELHGDRTDRWSSAGTAGYLENRLQSVLNAAARLIFFLVGRQNTQPHCSGTFTGYAYRSESSFGCVFWHITVCMAQHRRILQTACGRRQSLSLVAIFALPTRLRCWCRQLVG